MEKPHIRFLVLGWISLFACLVLAACEDVVYTSGEVAAKRKYESVRKGESREAVVKSLGAPMFELVLDKSHMKYEFLDQTGKRAQFDPTKELPTTGPVELRLFPRNVADARILVYSAGTVFGYIGLGDDNVVSFVKVVVS